MDAPTPKRDDPPPWLDDYPRRPPEQLPLALHDAHHAIAVGHRLQLRLFCRDEAGAGTHPPTKEEGFTLWERGLLEALFEGAGFEVEDRACLTETHPDLYEFRLVRRRTLADTVGPNMSILIVGLNPSLRAADAGVGFVSPSNRFWKAAIGAGLISEPRNPRRALEVDGVGMTDLVKRATARASEIADAEFQQGLGRLDAMVGLLKPAVVCVVGITGWRAAIGEHVSAGPQGRTVGARPVYLMPNPSGLNAHTNHKDLVDHFRRARKHS